MSKSRFDTYPIPDYLQWSLERNIGRLPVWKFPPIADSPEGLKFRRLCFENRHFMLEAFENDADVWVDGRFKSPETLYSYVAMLLFEMQFSHKHGGSDWLVFTPEKECAGVLHCFDFSKERYGFSDRKCEVGYAFAEKFRGTELPKQAMHHFQQYLFRQMDRLILLATPDKNNVRSCRFLEKLGWEDRSPDYDYWGDGGQYEQKSRFFELYRTPRTRAAVMKYRARSVQI